MSEPSVESFEDEFRANEFDKYWFRVTITYKTFSMIKLTAIRHMENGIRIWWSEYGKSYVKPRKYASS